MNEQSDTSAHPLSAIAGQFSSSETDANKKRSNQPPSPPPSLSLLKISSPAILIDHALRVVWQNEQACEALWHNSAMPAVSSDYPSIFDLLFSSDFQEHVKPWKQWLVLFLDMARNELTSAELRHLAERLPEKRRIVVEETLGELENRSNFSPSSGSHGWLNDGRGTVFNVVVTHFESNALMVFDPRPADAGRLGNSGMTGVEIRTELTQRDAQPTMQEVCFLAATLNHTATIRAEMLDEEYCHLVMRILQISTETIESIGGVVGQFEDAGVLGYFLSDDKKEDQPYSTIRCALEMKRKMLELGREWKIRKGWLHDIDLNIGIHAASEYIASVPSSMGGHLMTFGASLDIARHLSALATGGQIWATKALIARVSEEIRKSLRFGIFRMDGHRQVFIARYFSMIRDLEAASGLEKIGCEDISGCAVTQIFDQQGHG